MKVQLTQAGRPGLFFLSLFVSISALSAQTGKIRLTTTRPVGQTLTLNISSEEVFSLDGASLDSGNDYTIEKQTIEIRGNITGLMCNDNELTSLDFSSCPSIISIGCNNNKLTELNLSGCEKIAWLNCSVNLLTRIDAAACKGLKWLYCYSNRLAELIPPSKAEAMNTVRCYDNKLNGKGMSDFLRALPAFKKDSESPDTSQGLLLVDKSDGINDGNSASKEDIAVVSRDRAWPVWQKVNDEARPYEGIATGLESVVMNRPDISVYPNPTRGLLHLDKVAAGERITLYAADGTLLIESTTESVNAIDLSNFPAGVYILQVGTRTVSVVRL